MTLTKINSKGIKDSEILNADINASAAIAGTKIAPDFGSQNVVTTGTLGSNNLTISNDIPKISLVDTNDDDDFDIINQNGTFTIRDETNSADRLRIYSSGTASILGNLDVGAGIDVTGAITGSGDMTIDSNTFHVDSSNEKVSLGTTTTNTSDKLTIVDAGNSFISIRSDAEADNTYQVLDFAVGTASRSSSNMTASIGAEIHSQSGGTLKADLGFSTNSGDNVSQKMIIKDTGNVGIGTSDPLVNLQVESTDPNIYLTNKSGNTNPSNAGTIHFREAPSTPSFFIFHNGQSNKLIFGGINGGNTFSHITLDRGDANISAGANIIIPNGNGIDFSGTSDGSNASNVSELLDDYEEGTFTPTLKSSSVTTGQQTGIGTYTKIGNLVHVNVDFESRDFTGIPNGHVVQITGMPFTSRNTTHTPTSTVPMTYKVYTRENAAFYIGANVAHLNGIYPNSGVGWSNLPTDDINQSDVYINFSISYTAA